MKKKLILLLSLISLLAITLVFGACGGPAPAPKTFSVNERVTVLIEGTVRLTTKLDDETVTGAQFVSEDQSIAVVSTDGIVTGKREGTTTINVSYQTYTAKCEVTVQKGESVPFIRLDNISQTTVNTSWKERVNLTPTVSYNGNDYTDYEVSYSIKDPTLGEMEGNIYKPLTKGTNEITVSVSWRGFTDEETITVVAYTDVELAIKDVQGDINLFAKEQVGGELFLNKITLECAVSVDGEPSSNYNLEVIEGQDKVTLENGVLTAVKAGNAKIKLSVEDSFGDVHSKDYNVNIQKALVSVAVDYAPEFDATLGTLDTNAIFGYDTTIVEAYEGETALTVEEGAVKGITVSGIEKDTDKTITVYDETCGFTINLVAYTRIFKEASDFDYFAAKTASADLMPVYDGYYVVANDIDASSYTTQPKRLDGPSGASSDNSGNYRTRGLMGTFDGRGHIISGMTFDCSGLFGIIGNKGTVKNVAFTGAKLKGSYWNTSCVLAFAIYENAEVENVFIEVTNLKNGGSSSISAPIGYAINVDAKLKNLVIIADDNAFVTPANNSGVYGMSYRLGRGVSNAAIPAGQLYTTAWEGVYVISNQEVEHLYQATGVNDTNAAKAQLSGLYTYDSIASFRTAYNAQDSIIKNNIDNLDKNIWKVEGGIPYFKNYEVIEKLDLIVDLDQSVGKFSDADLTAMFGSANVNITAVSEINKAFDVEVGANNTLTLKSGDNAFTATGETYTVNVTADRTVQIKITPVTKVIKQASDLDVLKAESTSQLRGYYILGNDIDASSYTVKYWSTEYNTTIGSNGVAPVGFGFLGTFDGRGHTIKGLTSNCGGLFNVIGGAGVVKNVGFTDVKLTGYNETTGEPNWRPTHLFARTICAYATLENIYIEVSNFKVAGTSTETATLSNLLSDKAIVKNVVVVATADTTNTAYSITARLQRDSGKTYTRDSATLNDIGWSNIYSVSNQKIEMNQKVIAQNDTNPYTTSGVMVKNVFGYADVEAFKTAYNATDSAIKANIDGFDSAYWQVVDGMITWKTAK